MPRNAARWSAWPLGAIAVTSVALAGCSAASTTRGTGDALSPLAISQKLADAKVPCEDQALDKREASTSELVDGKFSFPYPEQTVLTCDATGGPFRIVIWSDESGAAPSLKAYCAERSVLLVRSEYVDAPEDEAARFLGPDLALGSNWVAVASPDSIVATADIAAALGGEAASSEATCAGQGSDFADVAAAERARLDAVVAEERKQQELNALRGNPQEQMKLAQDETLSPVVMLELAKVADNGALCLLSRNAAATEQVLDVVLQRAGKEKGTGQFDAPITLCVANSEATSPATLEKLAKSDNLAVAVAARQNLDGRG